MCLDHSDLWSPGCDLVTRMILFTLIYAGTLMSLATDLSIHSDLFCHSDLVTLIFWSCFGAVLYCSLWERERPFWFAYVSFSRRVCSHKTRTLPSLHKFPTVTSKFPSQQSFEANTFPFVTSTYFLIHFVWSACDHLYLLQYIAYENLPGSLPVSRTVRAETVLNFYMRKLNFPSSGNFLTLVYNYYSLWVTSAHSSTCLHSYRSHGLWDWKLFSQ